MLFIVRSQENNFLLLFLSTQTVCEIRKDNKFVNAEPHS